MLNVMCPAKEFAAYNCDITEVNIEPRSSSNPWLRAGDARPAHNEIAAPICASWFRRPARVLWEKQGFSRGKQQAPSGVKESASSFRSATTCQRAEDAILAAGQADAVTVLLSVNYCEPD
jgi:hypothetical protein